MKRIFAVAVMLFVAILSGCATVNYTDPNRPLPPQPNVPVSIKTELVAKPMKSFCVFPGNVVYYDAGDFSKTEGNINFTKAFPKLNNPSTETVVAAYRFLKVFRGHLQNEGYQVVDEARDSCLRLDIDFATVTLKADTVNPIFIIFVRTRVFFKNIEVLESGDDLLGGTKKGILESKESAKNQADRVSAIGFTKELERVWRIAIQDQKISMAQ